MLAIFEGSKFERPLPKNRFEQFFYIFVSYFNKMALLSLLTALFFLPLIVFMYISTIVDSALYASILNGEEVSIELIQELKMRSYFNLLFYVPFTGIAFIGLSGMFGVLKKYTWRQLVDLPHDFFISIKNNLLFSFIVGIIYGLIMGAILTSDLFFNEKIIWNIVGFIIISFVSIFFFYVLTLNIYYEVHIGQLFFNSLMLLIIRLPYNIFSIIIAFLPILFLIFLPTILGMTIMVILYILLYLSISSLALITNNLSGFDKYINKKTYPEFYKKGLDSVKNHE